MKHQNQFFSVIKQVTAMTPSQKRNNNRSFVVKQLALLINFEKKINTLFNYNYQYLKNENLILMSNMKK